MQGKDTIACLSLGASPGPGAITQSESLFRLDAATDEYSISYRVAKAMTIDEVCLNVIGLTGTPTYTVTIEGVSVTDGSPDGSILDSCTVQWSPTANGLQWVGVFAASASTVVAVGDMICIHVADGTTGNTPSASHYVDLVSHAGQASQDAPPVIKNSTDTGSTWNWQAVQYPSFAFRDSSDTTDVQGNPVENWFYQGNITTDNNHIFGQGFMLSPKLGKRVQVHGIEIGFMYNDCNNEIGIWDSDGSATLMSSVAIDDDMQNSVFANQIGFFTPVWLETNHLYYAGCKQKEATGFIIMYQHDAVTDDNLSAFAGYPNNQAAKYVSSWTKETGSMVGMISLFVLDWDHDSDVLQPIGSGIIMP